MSSTGNTKVEKIAVVYSGTNMASLPHAIGAGGKKYGHFTFTPGTNMVDVKVWESIKEYNKGRWHHFGPKLKEVQVSEAIVPSKEGDSNSVDVSKLGAEEAITLIGGASDLIVLQQYFGQESKGKNRKTVLEAIDAQMEEVETVLAQIEEEKKKKAAGEGQS